MHDLPAPYREARAADEAFWKEQEKRVQGATGQPACTLSGISTTLIAMEGEFAVVIHGEDECASCFIHHGPAAHRFFCTGLTEEHFVRGVTGPRLRHCLELVIEELAPEVVIVLGACPIEVIGDQFHTVVDDVGAEHPHVTFRALHTSGLKVGSQTAMLDWLYSTLVGLPTKPPLDPSWRQAVADAGLDVVDAFLEMSPRALRDSATRAASLPAPAPIPREDCVAFLGMPDPRDLGGERDEWMTVLADVGLHVIGNLPYGASLDDWQAASHAGAVLVLDRENFRKTAKALEAAGAPVHDVPLPVGIAQTDTFYRILGEATGRTEAIQAAVSARRAEAQQAAEAARARFEHVRMALGLRLQNNYKTDLLASQGLGDRAAFVELGFDVTLLLQGPPEKRDRFMEMYARRGLDVQLEVFPDPWSIGDHLMDRFDIAVLADHMRAECQRARVPMLVSRMMHPGYAGVARNAARLADLLDHGS